LKGFYLAGRYGVLFDKYGDAYRSPSLGINASVPLIFDSILDSFSISSDVPIGSGSIFFDYNNAIFGGGQGSLTLTPYSITASDQVTAVPRPSTWAMLLIGFAGIGFAGYRRRQGASTRRFFICRLHL